MMNHRTDDSFRGVALVVLIAPVELAGIRGVFLAIALNLLSSFFDVVDFGRCRTLYLVQLIKSLVIPELFDINIGQAESRLILRVIVRRVGNYALQRRYRLIEVPAKAVDVADAQIRGFAELIVRTGFH